MNANCQSFFLKTSAVKVNEVIDNSTSYFTGIKDWSSWDLPYEGMKAKLIKYTQSFRETHQETIRNSLQGGDSEFETIANIALVDSCEWINSLIQFVDQTYRDYERAKFDKIKAWHLTTRLATRLIKKIFVPRHGLINQFEMGDPKSIGKVIFWATFRSLAIMSSIRRVGMANEPSVSAELVKFLATHTEFDTIQKLAKNFDSTKNDISSIQSELKALTKSDKTANNKAQEAKDQVKAVVTRVEKLERKVA